MDKNPRLSGKKPLVIHVVTSLDFGGVERHMEVIGKVLSHARFRYLFVAIGDGGAAEKKLQALDADLLCLGKKTKIASPGAIYALLKLFRRERPVVVHTHGAEANFHGLLAARVANVSVRIGEEIGIPSHSELARRVFRYVYSTAHCVIGISQAVTDWLIESGEANSENAIRIYNPVDLPEPRLKRDLSDEVFQIGFVGRLEPVKNPKVLLEVLGILQSKGISAELWLIGDGSERDLIETYIHEHGLENRVHLLGYQDDPSKFIRRCHVYIQPSLSEGFGLAIVEAMGCGLPVIATATGGVPEIVQDGITGWIIENHDVETITTALLKAWQLGSDQLLEMGKRARGSVANRFEPINYLAQLETLYSNMGNQIDQ